MKKLLFLLILSLTYQGLRAQNAYYDALFLSEISVKDIENICKADSLCGEFNLSELQITSLKNLKVFLDNPFNDSINPLEMDIYQVKKAINEYNDAFKLIEDCYLYSSARVSTKFSNLPNGQDTSNYKIGPFLNPVSSASTILGLIPSAVLGGFSLSGEDQTKILDGLTKYYAEEFKKAQLLTYMQTFKSTIGKVGEFQVLFPNTYNKLKYTNPSKFPDLGDEYKEIFSQDLRSLIDNVIKHIDNHASYEKDEFHDFEIELKGYSELKYYVSKNNASFDSSLQFLKGINTLKIKAHENYPSVKIASEIGSKLIQNYHPVDLFNYLDETFYKPSYLTSAAKLEEKLGVIIHGVNLFQRNLLDTAKSKSSQFSNVWLNYEEFNEINTFKEWNYFVGLLYQKDKEFFKKVLFTPSTSSLTTGQIQSIKETYLKLLSSLNQIQEFRSNLTEENLNENFIEYMKIVTNVFQSAKYTNDDISKFFAISNYSLQVYDNARSKDYSNSIYYLTLILNEFLGTDSTYLETMQKIDRYGSFMTDVINSEDSDEVKEVIMKHAAPPASFILKREYARTFSITGQPGYFISSEKLDDKWRFVSGITLPMGFDFSFKLKKGIENSNSLGIFVQLIDLGAMLNFRISDATSTLPDKVEFSQIYSPGISLTHGWKNSPITLGLGYQYTPKLRQVTLENGNEDYPNGHRIFLRLAWDIPFLNICKSKLKE